MWQGEAKYSDWLVASILRTECDLNFLNSWTLLLWTNIYTTPQFPKIYPIFKHIMNLAALLLGQIILLKNRASSYFIFEGRSLSLDRKRILTLHHMWYVTFRRIYWRSPYGKSSFLCMLQQQLQDLYLIRNDLAPLGLEHVRSIFQIAPCGVKCTEPELGHNETPNM